MKTTKLAAKFFLINILFAANVLADDDGQMNGGNKTCNPQVQTCLREEPAGETDSNTGSAPGLTTDSTTDTMFDFIKEYLASWII